MNLVTIITPVYNGESFLEESVGSVFWQTYPEIELIAIDDGSEDHSFDKLQELKAKAPAHVSMRILTRENKGICATRNQALDLAQGRYIMFLDQDDSLREDCVDRLVREMQAASSDMVIGGYDLVDESCRVLEKWTLDPSLPWCKFRISAPWGRLFRREIIENNRIRFMITKISEDFYFNLVYMSFCRSITVIDYRGYAWRYSPKSESHANMSRYAKDRDVLKVLSRSLKDMNSPCILEPDLVAYMMVKHVIWYLLFTAKSVDRKDLRYVYRRSMRWLDRFFPSWYKNRQISLLRPKGESFRVRAVVRAAVTLQRMRLLLPVLAVYARV